MSRQSITSRTRVGRSYIWRSRRSRKGKRNSSAPAPSIVTPWTTSRGTPPRNCTHATLRLRSNTATRRVLRRQFATSVACSTRRSSRRALTTTTSGSTMRGWRRRRVSELRLRRCTSAPSPRSRPSPRNGTGSGTYTCGSTTPCTRSCRRGMSTRLALCMGPASRLCPTSSLPLASCGCWPPSSRCASGTCRRPAGSLAAPSGSARGKRSSLRTWTWSASSVTSTGAARCTRSSWSSSPPIARPGWSSRALNTPCARWHVSAPSSNWP
mmetsp:Transcript_20803/g.58534  ORF Transcript_20803/g.58534 Transcript_20803/m.58534 type:complete len:268 (-) Transcript_20803:512-1315(-)